MVNYSLLSSSGYELMILQEDYWEVSVGRIIFIVQFYLEAPQYHVRVKVVSNQPNKIGLNII